MIEEFLVSLRLLRRARGLTVISMLTVALGVGAGTSLFSVVKAVLLNPLPYPHAEQLVRIAEVMPAYPENQVSYPDYEDWRRQNHSFMTMAAYDESPINVGGDEAPLRTIAAPVTEDFFDVMGVRPMAGRTFSPSEEQSGLTTVILGYGLWRRAFGGDRRILGRTILLDGAAATVIGIMPEHFAFPDGTELWVPFLGYRTGRTAHNYRVVARLRAGITIENAREDISAIARRIKAQYPSPFQSDDASTVSLKTSITGPVRVALLVLFTAVGFLLLIVCVNVANLLLVRVTVRTREMAVRTALGAGRWHLLRQTLVESLLLALGGGALGFLVAGWSMELLKLLLPSEVPRVADIRMDYGVAAFALAISAAAGLLFGALPAWCASRLQVQEGLRAGARSYTAGKRFRRTQAVLVISEVALSLVLLAGAGILARSFLNLRAVDPGFQADHVLTASLNFPSHVLDPRLIEKHRQLLKEVRALPGVQAAATVKDLPLDPIQRDGNFQIESRSEVQDADAGYLIVSPEYFRALRIPLLRGRDLAESDSETSAPVVVISAGLARQYFPGMNPLGQRIWFVGFERDHVHPRWLTVVGVVADVRQWDLVAHLRPIAYIPYSQVTLTPALAIGNLVVRTALDAASLTTALRERIHAVDPGAAVTFKTMDSMIAAATARQRFQMQILGAFAALALLLAAIGIYGVLSYTVTSTRGEIGIRIALGAQPKAVFGMIMRRALILVAVGAALGFGSYLAMHRVLETVLFGVGSSDPATLTEAIAVLLAVALAASWLPARRAVLIDPCSALREE